MTRHTETTGNILLCFSKIILHRCKQVVGTILYSSPHFISCILKFIFNRGKICLTKFPILTILSIQSRCVKYIHIVVWHHLPFQCNSIMNMYGWGCDFLIFKIPLLISPPALWISETCYHLFIQSPVVVHLVYCQLFTILNSNAMGRSLCIKIFQLRVISLGRFSEEETYIPG